MVEIPESVKKHMQSAQPDELILAKTAAAAVGAWLFKKLAVIGYEAYQARRLQTPPEPPTEDQI